MKPAKKLVSCPRCSRRLTLQGLNGHLRFVHGVGADQVAATMVRGTLEERATRALELMRSLKEIRLQREELSRGWRKSHLTGGTAGGRRLDRVLNAFERAFERLESEIVDELGSLHLLDDLRS